MFAFLCFFFSFSNQLSIEFDLAFEKGYNSYFGYIFRIQNEDRVMVDVIYEAFHDSLKHNMLNVIFEDLRMEIAALCSVRRQSAAKHMHTLPAKWLHWHPVYWWQWPAWEPDHRRCSCLSPEWGVFWNNP